MPAENVEVRGLEQATAMLNQLSTKGARNVVTRTTRRAAKPLVKIVRSLAPKDTGLLRKSIRLSSVNRDRKTGQIRGSIRSKATKSQEKKAGRAVRSKAKRNRGRVFYDVFQAQGTKFITGKAYYDKGASRGFGQYVSEFRSNFRIEFEKEKAKTPTRK